MATGLPAAQISFRGAAQTTDALKPGSSSGVVFKLSDGILRDLKRASESAEGISFVAGSNPKLRLGGRLIDLTITSDPFRNELFASNPSGPSTDFTYTSILSHRAELTSLPSKSNDDLTRTDLALATLQKNLASYEQEKQAKQANISTSVLPAPKSRFDMAKQEKLEKKRLGGTPRNGTTPVGSPSLYTNASVGMGLASTSVPASEDAVKLQAMKKVVLHMLAVRPYKSEQVVKQSHIPKAALQEVLQRLGRQVDGQWQLADRAFKDLDVWSFKYRKEQDRDQAIENAIKAYDRLRLGKDEKLWQMLLPMEERGKRIVLSRLHFVGGPATRGLTPLYQSISHPHADSVGEGKATPVPASMTPRMGASGHRPTNSKGDVTKRLLARDPKKARAAEEAKEKKRKEREPTTGDREGERPSKRQATSRKANPNIKSAEFISSSDDENLDEQLLQDIARGSQPSTPSPVKQTKPASKAQNARSSSSDSSDGVALAARRQAVKKAVGDASEKAPSQASPAERTVPKPANTVPAPNATRKVQHSPQKIGTLPKVPSPLGVSRPRVTSDLSDRWNGVARRAKQEQQGSETPKGLGITSNGGRKRHDTVTSTDSVRPNGLARQVKQPAALKSSREVPTADVSKSTIVNGTTTKMDVVKSKASNIAAPSSDQRALKRKADDAAARKEDKPANKHRKTDSTSSQSHSARSSSDQLSNGTARTSPESGDAGVPSVPERNTASPSHGGNGLNGILGDVNVLDSITYNQGVTLAEKFQTVMYPAYERLYDELEAKMKRGDEVTSEERERLWQMHDRCEQTKREIVSASKKEHEG